MALAAVLGCSLDVLTGLRLCRWPGAAEPRWTPEEDVAKIVGRFGDRCSGELQRRGAIRRSTFPTVATVGTIAARYFSGVPVQRVPLRPLQRRLKYPCVFLLLQPSNGRKGCAPPFF
jgi:hypothetical protein